MLRFASTTALAVTAAVCWLPRPTVEPVAAVTPTAASAAVHCQVPCGIYGDKLRIDLLVENVATIEKAMGQIAELGAEGTNYNQIVRWVTTKDEHAQKIQDQVADYWLAQRIKLPAEDTEAAMSAYLNQLATLHGLTVSAMKCKQTVSTEHTGALTAGIATLVASYFSGEDQEHLRGSHGFGGDDQSHEEHSHEEHSRGEH